MHALQSCGLRPSTYWRRFAERRTATQPANCCCQFFVFCATTTDPVTAERMMIDEFHRRVGRLPFANRRRGSAATI